MIISSSVDTDTTKDKAENQNSAYSISRKRLLALKLIGRRIRLIDTEDPYTLLRSGDCGIIIDVCEAPFEDSLYLQIWVNWDRNVKLCLLDGIDRYELIDE